MDISKATDAIMNHIELHIELSEEEKKSGDLRRGIFTILYLLDPTPTFTEQDAEDR